MIPIARRILWGIHVQVNEANMTHVRRRRNYEIQDGFRGRGHVGADLHKQQAVDQHWLMQVVESEARMMSLVLIEGIAEVKRL